MSETINSISLWLYAHPHFAGLATFIISAAESIAIIGTIVPGTVMMTAVGALAGAGVIPIWSALLWAILGAIAGDGVSYWMGYHFKDRLRYIWPFKNSPNLLDSGEKFFLKYGGMSVFIGRFIGPVRALVPLVAGMMGMSPLRFFIANATSAIGWAPLYMFPGILFGIATLELPPDIAVHALLALFLTGLFIIFCFWIVYKLFASINKQITQLLNWIWQKLEGSRYFYLITTALKHHDKNKTHGQLALAFYLIIVSVTFLYLAAYISLHSSSDIAINNAFFHLFRSLRTASCDNVMVFITLFGDKRVLIPVMIVLFAWLTWKRCWYTAWHALALLIFTAGSIFVFKYLVHSPRPWGILHSSESFSFPSGHTTLSTTFYIALGLLLLKVANIKRKWPTFILLGLMVGAVSLSRLYLGAHWFTDILGGWLLSASLLILIGLSYNRNTEKKIPACQLFFVILISLAASVSFLFYRHFDDLKQNYTMINWPMRTLSVEAWWDQTGEALPTCRIGRIGLKGELFNLQWAGNLADIKNSLLQAGWEEEPGQDWIDILHRITDVKSAEHLPLVPPLYLDKVPVLLLTKHYNGEKRLIVLRLWDSNIILGKDKLPLWVGSVGAVPRTYSWVFNYKNNEVPLTTDLLFDKVSPPAYDIKQVSFMRKNKRKKHVQHEIIFIKPKTH